MLGVNDEKLALYMELSDALCQDDVETLGEAAERVLADPSRHPCWAAARCIVDSGHLRHEEAWAALARAHSMLPKPGQNG